MPPDRDVPRGDAPASRLRFDRAEAAASATERHGPSRKRTAARFIERDGMEEADSHADAPLAISDETAAHGEKTSGQYAVKFSEPLTPALGQSVPKSVFRQESSRAESVLEHGAAGGKLRQDSDRGSPLAEHIDTGQPAWKRRAAATQKAEVEQDDQRDEPDDPCDMRRTPTEHIPESDRTRAWRKQARDTARQTVGRKNAAAKLRQESSQPKASDRLHHEDEGSNSRPDKPEPDKLKRSKRRMERRGEKLERARDRLEKQKPVRPPAPVKQAAALAGRTAQNYVHKKIYEVEHENVGVEAAHRTELAGEAIGRDAVRFTKERVRSRSARDVRRAESRYIKATADHHFKQTVLEHPEMQKKPLTRMWRKRRQRQQYVKRAREAAKQSARATEKTAVTAAKIVSHTVDFVKKHPAVVVVALFCILFVLLMQSCATSVTAITEGLTGTVAVTTYPAEDADMLGAEAVYVSMEAELQARLDNYENTHDYDEYVFELDSIEHDPYVLLSILSAFHPDGWTLADVRGDMRSLFAQQYTLTEDAVTETRYRTEAEIKSRTVTDPDTGAVTTEEYEEDVEVPYDYTICTVTLENYNLSHLPVFIMSEEQLSRYSLYMKTLGNRPDLFPTSAYVLKYGSVEAGYTIPPEALSDEKFAAMIAEAEKYIGYPYVWGGSSPATSFDCSGFLSWVINNCGLGWNYGRLGAIGLANICTMIPASEAKPGDLVFFNYTYAAEQPWLPTHCGLYVGNGMMLHCGDPIRYVSIETDYWQSHLYGFGRLP